MRTSHRHYLTPDTIRELIYDDMDNSITLKCRNAWGIEIEYHLSGPLMKAIDMESIRVELERES